MQTALQKVKTTRTLFRSKPKWLDARRYSIGGSDIPTILGATLPYRGPLELWVEKVKGLEHPDRKEETEAAEAGQVLEEPVALIYSRRTGRSLMLPAPRNHWVLIKNPKYPWAHVSPDRYIMAKRWGLLEIKTSGAYAIKNWVDEPPLAAQMQLQHGLMVLDYSWGSVAGMLSDWYFHFRHQDFLRNEKFIKFIAEKGEEFMYAVEHEKEPDPDGSASSRRALELLFPEPNKEEAKTIELGQEGLEHFLAIQRLNEQMKVEKEEMDAHKNKIRLALGQADATVGILPDGVTAYRWQNKHTDAYSVPARDARELRIVKWKGE